MTHDLYIVLSVASSLDHFTDQFQEIEVDTEIPQLGILKLTSGSKTQPEVMSNCSRIPCTAWFWSSWRQ